MASSRTLHGVTLIEAPTARNRAYIGYVSARELAEFASDENNGHRAVVEALFEDNVRGHLKGEAYTQNPGADGLAKTLLDRRGDDLLLLHNGIVIVGTALRDMGGVAVELTDPQIVNGCQSVHTLIEHFDRLSGGFLPIKIVITQFDQLKSNVIQSSNTQAVLDEYDFLARNSGLRSITADFAAVAIPLDQRLWLKRRRGEKIDWPSDWHGDTDWSRVVRPRHLLEAFVAAIDATPHVAHGKRGVALARATTGRIFDPSHEPMLYRALGWLVVTGRRWARRRHVGWHDLFPRSGAGAYPARHQYVFALWRIAEDTPEATSSPSLVRSEIERRRFARLITLLTTQSDDLGDAAGRAVQAAADRRRLTSELAATKSFTAQVRAAADEERKRLRLNTATRSEA